MSVRTASIRGRAVAAAASVLLLTAQGTGQAPEGAWEIYYQATYADGSVRDLNAVPTAKEHIRRVVRISRFERSGLGHRLIATGPYPVSEYDPGRTVKHDLTWDGRAWVARSRGAPHASAAQRAEELRGVLRGERRRLVGVLRELRSRLAAHDHAVASAERKLVKVKGADTEKPAAIALDKAKERRDLVLKAIELYELQGKALGRGGKAEFSAPTGEVSEGRSEVPGARTLGLDGEIGEVRTLPHRVQVWKVPPGRSEVSKGVSSRLEPPRRTVQVGMRHVEGGPLGAFHYVAYADTDDDGRPDRMLARSPLAVSPTAGGWTNWRFTTAEPNVFVGNAWTRPDTSVYFARPPRDFVGEHWGGMSSDVYVSGFFGGIPFSRYPYAPYLTNIRVHVSNPFGPAESPPSEIIVR